MSEPQDYFNLAGTEDNTEEDDATHPVPGSSRAGNRLRRSGSASSASSSTSTIRQQRRQLQQQQQEQNSQRRLSQPLVVDTARSAVPSASTSPRRAQIAHHPMNSRFRTQSSSNLGGPGGLHRRRSRLRRGTSVSMSSNPNLADSEDDDEEGEDEEEEGDNLEERRNKWNRVRATLPRRHTYHSEQVPDEYLAELGREEAEGANDYDGELTLKDRQDVSTHFVCASHYGFPDLY